MNKILIGVKIDPRMKKALQRVADEQLVSMSTLIRQLIDKHLKGKDVDWRKEKVD